MQHGEKPLEIAISGKFSDDLFDEAFAVADKLRAVISNAGLAEVDTDLAHFVFFPVIISDELGIENKSHRSFSRKERAEFANVEIDIETWSKADPRRQLELMMDALQGAIRDTPSSRLKDEAKEVINTLLETALKSNLI